MTFKASYSVHVCQLPLHELVGSDWLTKLLSFMDIRQNHVQSCLHKAQRACTEDQSLKIETFHQHSHSFVDLAKHVLVRHKDIVKHEFARVATSHAKLVQLSGTRKAFGTGVYYECRDTF